MNNWITGLLFFFLVLLAMVSRYAAVYVRGMRNYPGKGGKSSKAVLYDDRELLKIRRRIRLFNLGSTAAQLILLAIAWLSKLSTTAWLIVGFLLFSSIYAQVAIAVISRRLAGHEQSKSP